MNQSSPPAGRAGLPADRQGFSMATPVGFILFKTENQFNRIFQKNSLRYEESFLFTNFQLNI